MRNRSEVRGELDQKRVLFLRILVAWRTSTARARPASAARIDWVMWAISSGVFLILEGKKGSAVGWSVRPAWVRERASPKGNSAGTWAERTPWRRKKEARMVA
ncbi:MAG: hypothetical protein ABS32_02305 [Verrucomicrobia subdivision 6 bacterium BACL9 MAG-120820-bin42]|uniref:Uncharacterized protein n=1 Tax=Verrucomicrobia subdivision 6 bacterium BACL9 MAG-120820-bin42 TaxID=1655634 RepID=A0A0R2XF51_9BACT|nr:MAG: hypothetical protein ABS32_02305 [Verrucomicrobia subdivision 6 bacterium BACL9 MAG-120820-bin42]